MKINETKYIEYLAHMLDESCNDKACSYKFKETEDVDEAKFEFVPLGNHKSGSSSSSSKKSSSAISGKGKSNKAFSVETLHNMSREDAVKNDVDIDMWQAAQLPFPHEEKHGGFSGGCSIIGNSGNKKDGEYLESYKISGTFKDGEHFHLYVGSNRRVASMYLKLHKISVLDKQWSKFQQDLDLKSDPSSSAYDKSGNMGFKFFDELQDFVSIIMLNDGFYIQGSNKIEDIKMNDNGETEIFHRAAKIGPFPDKVLARKYAINNEMKFGPPSNNKVDKVDHIYYPIFVFDYEMTGIDCMDIVIAETKNIAMKMFAIQWKMFDNSKVYRQVISSENDLEKELMTLRIKNINVYEIKKSELQEYIDISKQIGNPMTNPKLKMRQRNQKCQYILGPSMKSGRCPVSIEQNFNRTVK